MSKNGLHIIFEGAELAGKSHLMNQLYNYLEPKYNSGGQTMDGCHWFNLDVGLYGSPQADNLLDRFTSLMEDLPQRNILIEKFHLSQATYQKLFHDVEVNFVKLEKRLKALDAKIILVTFPEDEVLLAQRLADRLRLYPHYSRIARTPSEYIEQQRLMIKMAQVSQLPIHIVKTTVLPDPKLDQEILEFLKQA